ncbi:MAG: putative ATP-binding cassette sub-family E member 1 [Streblomastix strix]|uniref:Putative ATP-binding cassette sub-family E member 1 n=1 Tax=Streblomastix strix TaxID=222440 RepID=A0A5J4U165_9EUKA|nr:MAG: putative ATP-binding cassette sub-family E member 1 [Streblomastix strix]
MLFDLFLICKLNQIVEYTRDIVNVVYGKRGVYGVVTLQMHVRDGVKNNIPVENLRFREYEQSFKQSTREEDGKEKPLQIGATTHHPEIHMTIGPFKIVCESGSFQKREIIVLLGENGTEKTTFLNLITEVNESGKDKLKQQEKAALIEKERIEKEKIEKEKETERIKRERETERQGLQPILNLKTVRQLISQIIDHNEVHKPLQIGPYLLDRENNQTISKKDSN